MSNWFNILFTCRFHNRQLALSVGDAANWIYITLAAIGLVWMVWHIRRLMHRGDALRATKIVRGLALACVASYIVPNFLMCAMDTGERWIDNLPLQLCYVAGIVTPIAVWRRNETLLNLSFGLFAPGALFAIATPDIDYRSLSYLSVHYVLFNAAHWVLAVTPLAAIAAGLFTPKWRYYPRIVVIGMCFMAIVFPLNKLLGTNYLFINYPESGTILATFSNIAGNPGYIAILIIFSAAAVALIYALFTGLHRCFPVRRNSQAEQLNSGVLP